MSQLLLGPKAFPLDRLLAILDNLSEGSIHAIGHGLIYSRVSSLVSLKLLDNATRGGTSREAHSENLNADFEMDGVRIRCNVSYEDILKVARVSGLNLNAYLFDPNQ